jgi:SAM-dependent methyltransferase
MSVVFHTAEAGELSLGRKIENACPCCGEGGARVIYCVPSIPVHSCVLLSTAADACAFPRRDLQLAFCERCGFLFNHIFDHTAIGYSSNFEESQHFSGTFTSFARGLAQEIAVKCALRGKNVLEIGCGKGEFLRELCEIGNASGVGIDPAYRADEGRATADNLRVIVDYYDTKYQDIPADLVLCRHTLEHIAPVSGFIASVRDAIGARKDTWIVFETPDAHRILNDGAFWDIYYEHCSYFSLGTHARLFRRQGFDVTDVSLVYGAQYIVQYARPAPSATRARLPGENDLAEVEQLAATFPSRVRDVQEKWRQRLRRAAENGQRIVLWGGSSKAVAFLTTLGLREEIAAVVDVNPYKQGKFMPGTGHAVIAPSELNTLRPDLIVVMNPIYLTEVRAELSRLGFPADILAL